MKKLYLLMLTALLGGALANAQTPLEGYEAPTAVVYNLLGSAVAESAEPATDLSNLPAGIYLAKVSINGNHTIVRFKK